VDSPKPKGDGDVQVQVEPIARRAVEALFFCHVPALGQIYNGPICFFFYFLFASICLFIIYQIEILQTR